MLIDYFPIPIPDIGSENLFAHPTEVNVIVIYVLFAYANGCCLNKLLTVTPRVTIGGNRVPGSFDDISFACVIKMGTSLSAGESKGGNFKGKRDSSCGIRENDAKYQHD